MPSTALDRPHRARTTFAGNTNPWRPLMNNPQPSTGNAFTDAARRPGPAAGSRRHRPRIDLSKLTVQKDIPPPQGRNIIGKYDAYFRKLEPKDAVKCLPDEVSPVANAMRKWIRDNKLEKKFTVLSQKNCDDDLTAGRVWLWPLDESLEGSQHERAAGARAAQSKGASNRKTK